MNKSKIVFLLLIVLTSIIPALAVAESEDDEENENEERETGENEREDGIGGFNLSNTILYITLVAIASVVGYSAYKIYRARKKTTKKLG